MNRYFSGTVSAGLLFLYLLCLSVINVYSENVIRTKPVILKKIYHDDHAFTQGLLYFNGVIYESTGLYDKSTLRCLKPENGQIVKSIKIPDIFAEGIAQLGRDLVQLSWQEKVAIVYTLPNLEQKNTYTYAGEGWGLTSDSSSFIMSNGSDTLFIRSKNFNLKKTIIVMLDNSPVTNLNELEFVDGTIYANIWHKSIIIAIQLKTGVVKKVIDCADLVREASVFDPEKVLNGIAYNPISKSFFVTGKMWPIMFEVKW
jgi:glutaminyl-peptide cyclotransferase